MKIRDRIKELRRVKAANLVPNPRNWRTHPQAQQDALRCRTIVLPSRLRPASILEI